jgi:WD40 repeat protein
VDIGGDGRRVVLWCFNETLRFNVRVWDVATGRPLTPPLENELLIRPLSPDSRWLLTGNGTRFRLWDAATGKFVAKIEGNLAEFSPDSRRLIVAGSKELRVLDLETLKAVTRLIPAEERVRHAKFSPDGRRLLTTGGPVPPSLALNSGSSVLQVWDAETLRPLGVPLKFPRSLARAELSRNGKRVAGVCYYAGPRTEVKVWDVATGRLLAGPFRREQGGWNWWYAHLSPDGRRLLTVTGYKGYLEGDTYVTREARVWDVDTGQPLTPALTHPKDLIHAAFSPDGRLVISQSNDYTRVWEAASGQPVTPLFPQRGNVSPDGRRLVLSPFRRANQAVLWELSPDNRPAEDLIRLAEALAGRRLAPSGSLLPLSAEEFRRAWEAARAAHPGEFRSSVAKGE